MFKARRAEHMHTKACSTKTMIDAVKGWAEADDVTDHEVILALQDNIWFEAREYLVEGVAECICNADGQHPCMGSCCDYGLWDGIATDPSPEEKYHSSNAWGR